jgi:cytosine deaminase
MGLRTKETGSTAWSNEGVGDVQVDFQISNCRLRGRDGLYMIDVKDGKINSITRSGRRSNAVIDAKGGMVTESYVIAHLHLDKVMTGSLVDRRAVQSYQNEKMDTRKAISLASSLKKHYNEEDITKRVRNVLKQSIRFGATHLRAFIDVDTKAKLTAVRAMLKVRREFRSRLTLQLVAFPQEGIASDPGAEEYVRKAMAEGADVVGGIPWIEKTERKQSDHIDIIFKIAKEFDRPVAMLVDDEGDARLRTLQMFARRAVDEGWVGRVQACHARATQLYTEKELSETIKLCRLGRVGIVVNPHTGPINAPVRRMVTDGLLVALGQDDCYDAYYPFGRCKMTEVAFLASHILRMMTQDDMETLYDMVTVNPAKIIGIGDFSVRPGCRANLVVLGTSTVHQTLLEQAEPDYVIHEGVNVFEPES